VIKNYFLLLMLKTVVLLNIFVETVMYFFFNEYKVYKNSIDLKYKSIKIH